MIRPKDKIEWKVRSAKTIRLREVLKDKRIPKKLRNLVYAELVWRKQN